MSRQDDGTDAVQVNPFSPTAISRVSESASDFFTVGTMATHEALALLTSLLDRDAEQRNPSEPMHRCVLPVP